MEYDIKVKLNKKRDLEPAILMHTRTFMLHYHMCVGIIISFARNVQIGIYGYIKTNESK